MTKSKRPNRTQLPPGYFKQLEITCAILEQVRAKLPALRPKFALVSRNVQRAVERINAQSRGAR